MLRTASLLVYAILAALGIALVSRPALLWVRSQGLLHAVPAWDVPAGPAFFALAIALIIAIAACAIATALGHRLSRAHHALLLALASTAFALRAASPDPRPPPDPNPSLLAALRAAADQLDALWAGSYAPGAGVFASAFAAVPPPGFRRLFRTAPLHVRVLFGAGGPQLDALEGDEAGTIYLAVAKDRGTAWLTALGTDGLARSPSHRAAVIEARGGTHSAPGGDPMVPEYPRARSATR